MSFSFLFQLLINGIIAGAIYALVSSGFSLIYTTNRFINFSHGAVVVLSAYITYLLFRTLELPFVFSGLLAMVFIAVFGVSTTKIVYEPLRKNGSSNAVLLVASICVLIVIESVLVISFGAAAKSYSLFTGSRGIELFGAIITPLEIGIIVTAIIVSALLYLFLRKCLTGKKMQAVSDEPELAESLGVSSKRIRLFAIIIASIIAGFGGILIGLEHALEPMMGTELMIKGFTGAVIGGVTSVPGAVVGAFMVGILENVGIAFLPSGFKDAITFMLLFVFLLFKPAGLFGSREVQNA